MISIRRMAILFLAIVTLGLTACKSDNNHFVDPNDSTGGDGTDNGAPTAATGFRVRLKAKKGIDAVLHKFGKISDACEIAKADKDNPQDMRCMLNMMEYDVWFQGFEYELNIPEGFCNYVVESPYMNYMLPAGRPPATASITVTDGAMTACTVDGVAVAGPPTVVKPFFSGTSCQFGDGEIFADGRFNCAYDYSRNNNKLPNCCQGKMNVSITMITNAPAPAPPTITNTVSEVDGGGRIKNCIDTPYRYISDWPKDTEGFPVNSIVDVANQNYTRTQKIPSEMDVNDQRPETNSVTFNSGFYGWDDYVTGVNAPITNFSAWKGLTVPRAFVPVNDRGLDETFAPGVGDANKVSLIPSAGDGSYLFLCLNPAGEIRHQIHLYLNEWNTIEAFQKYKSGLAPTSGMASAVSPNVTGVAGTDCSAVNMGQSCNTRWGFDDMIGAIVGGSTASYVFPGDAWTADP